MKIIEEASALLEVNTKSKFPNLSFLMMIWLNLLTKKHSLFHTNQEEFQSYLPIFYLIFAHSGAIVNYYYYIALLKSHAEKNFGVISITTSFPFLVFSIIILATGCSSSTRVLYVYLFYDWQVLLHIFKYSCYSSSLHSLVRIFRLINRKINLVRISQNILNLL